VRDADANAILAIILNFAAEHDVTFGLFARAEDRAAEALAAAQIVERNNQAAIAKATLARLAIRATDRDRAHVHLAPLRAELAIPYALSKHARNAVERALGEFEGLPDEELKPKAESRRPSLSRGAQILNRRNTCHTYLLNTITIHPSASSCLQRGPWSLHASSQHQAFAQLARHGWKKGLL
jgi:hypothetical protein